MEMLSYFKRCSFGGHVAAACLAAVVAGCSSDSPRKIDAPVSDARDAADSGGSDADAGAGDVPDVAGPLDPATANVCAISITISTYNPAMAGCGGVASCRGVLRYVNNSGVTLSLQVISFNVPDGVTCTKSHSSRWIIFDNGATSHRCVFTTNTANPWTVPPGDGFSFGYELSGGDVNDAGTPPDADPSDGGFPDADPSDGGSPDAGPTDAALPPSIITSITVSDPACMPPDGGADVAVPPDAPADMSADSGGEVGDSRAGDDGPAEAG